MNTTIAAMVLMIGPQFFFSFVDITYLLFSCTFQAARPCTGTFSDVFLLILLYKISHSNSIE